MLRNFSVMVRSGVLCFFVTLVILSIHVQFLHAQNLTLLAASSAVKEIPIKMLNTKDAKLRSMPPVKAPPAPKKTLVKKLQQKVKCKLENFNLMHECCKETTCSLFKQETRYKCYGGMTFIHSLNHIKIYSLNRYQDIETNKLNLTNNATLKALEVKFIECMFRNESLITVDASNTSVLNAQKISAYFKDVIDNGVNLQKSVETCISIASGIIANPQRSDYTLLPFVFTQCLMRELLMTCTLPTIPTEISYKDKAGTFRVFAEWCVARRNALQMCNIF